MQECLYGHYPNDVLVHLVCHDIQLPHRCRYRKVYAARINWSSTGGWVQKGGRGRGSSNLESNKVRLKPGSTACEWQKTGGKLADRTDDMVATRQTPIGIHCDGIEEE